MGIEFGVLICLFAWLGWWLDGKTGLADEFPAFLILGVFVGMVLGIYRMKVHLDRGSQSSRKSGKQSGRDDGSAS